METRKVRIIIYTGDANFIAVNEDELQRILFGLHKACKQFDLKISTSKTKALTISKKLLGSKFIEKIISFNYLGVTITSSEILARELAHQAK